MSIASNLGVAVISCAAALPAVAQFQVWTVDDDGPADFANLGNAMDAAADGDALLIFGGRYEPAVLAGKRLTLLAGDESPVEIEIVQVFGTLDPPALEVLSLTGDQPLLVVGLDLDVVSYSNVLLGSGSETFLWLQDASLMGGGGVEASGGSVVLRSCDVEGGVNGGLSAPFYVSEDTDAVRVRNAALLAYDSSLRGPRGSNGGCQLGFTCGSPGTGGDGMRLESGASAHLVAVALMGGDGMDLSCDQFGSTWYGDAGSGGDGIELQSNSQALAIGCTFEAGEAGTTETICSDGVAGVPVAGSGTLALASETRRRLTLTSLVREGEVAELEFEAPAGETVLVGLALTPALLEDPQIEGPLVLGNLLSVLPFGSMPASGSVQLNFPVGQLPPGIDFFTYYLQPVFIAPTGERRAGDPTAFTILDASF